MFRTCIRHTGVSASFRGVEIISKLSFHVILFPHEMFILLGENNTRLNALIFNPVLTKEKQTLQRLKQLLLPCFSFRDVVSMAYLDIVRCYRARHWAAATEHGRDAVDR